MNFNDEIVIGDYENGNIYAFDLDVYADNGGIQKATSRIRFATHIDIAVRIDEAGLKVERWLGDWTGRPWTPQAAEIITVGRLA